jgi:hypothetical protein
VRVDEDRDREAVPESGDDRILALPAAPWRVDAEAAAEDEEAALTLSTALPA